MVAKSSKEDQAEKMAAFLYENPICANCRKPISKYRVRKAKKDKWLPLCEKCDSFIKQQLEECKPFLKSLFG